MLGASPYRLSRLLRSYSTGALKPSAQLPILRVENATFYRSFPAVGEEEKAGKHGLFPGLSLSIPSDSKKRQHWAVTGPSNAGKTTLFQILRGQLFCNPPRNRSYPFLSSIEADSSPISYRNPARAIQYVGFDGEGGRVGKHGGRGAYLSARYESRREDTDFSVLDFLTGSTELNSIGGQRDKPSYDDIFAKIIADLRLEALMNIPMGNLSNGQTRRARIARALFGKPLLLLLDEPFQGLDPPTITMLSPLLQDLAEKDTPKLILALRPQDPLPEWITHLICLTPNCQIAYQGSKDSVLAGSAVTAMPVSQGRLFQTKDTGSVKGITHASNSMLKSKDSTSSLSRDGIPLHDLDLPEEAGEFLVEMQDVCVKYGTKEVLGGWKQHVNGKERQGLWWKVRRGERWGIFGPNGSGKTTLLSLICSDHPQAYSLPIRLFGRGRLPQAGQPGISIFDIQARIGQSSPEIHAFFPRNLTLRQTVQNAWADTFLGTPRLTYEDRLTVESCLQWFEAELNPAIRLSKASPVSQQPSTTLPGLAWADEIRFGDATFSAQRIALLLRAIVKKPDLVVLDEAFSGMDIAVRDKCMLFLNCGETRFYSDDNGPSEHGIGLIKASEPASSGHKVFTGLGKEQALICVSHIKEEVPGSVSKWLRLPEAISGAPPQFGQFRGPLERDSKVWDEIWNS